MNRHYTWLAVATVLVILVVPVACGPIPTAMPTTEVPTEAAIPTATNPPAVEPTATPSRMGGELNYGVDVEATSLDVNLDGKRVSRALFYNLYDGLVSLDPETVEFVPWLAKSWEISEDGRSYTFMLREDVKFHDGTPFNAEAVKFNFDRCHDPSLQSTALAAFAVYESTEVLNEYTVRINLKTRYAPFLDRVYLTYRMVSPAAVEKWGDADFARHPVGTGPFKFVEWVDGDHITLERNPDYNWAPASALHQGPAYLDRVIFHTIPEAGTRAAALETGEVQAVVEIPAEVERLQADPRFKAVVGYVSGVTFNWALNSTKPPTDELAVRQAMNYGVDREAIVKTIYGAYQAFGANTAAYNILTPNIFGYDPTAETYHYDPEKAKQLLDDAGWVDTDGDGIRDKGGQPLEIVLNTWEPESVVEVAQAQLREIGMDIIVGVLPTITVNDEQRMGRSHGSPVPVSGSDPDMLEIIFHSRNVATPQGGGFNLYFVEDPEIDRLLDEGSMEMDREKRAELYSQLQHRIMELALAFPLYHRDTVVIAREEVQQLRLDLGLYPVMYEVWLKQ